jgi:hypothetical protein
MTDEKPTELEAACTEVAREVLWRNGAASADVVETLAHKFLAIAEEHQHFVRQQRESDDVIANAVRYIAHVHAIPPSGTDTRWFAEVLHVLMELAVPNAGLTPSAATFLTNVQEGIRESLADVPEPRSLTRIEDDDAVTLQRMKDAGVEHGVASDMLDLLEKIYYGDPLQPEDKRMFYLAAVAAPLTRHARESE